MSNNHLKSPLIIFHMDMNYVCMMPQQIKGVLDTVATLGYNAVLWEIEDKIRWDTCPECVWPEAMSKQTFREILDYSRNLGLEPIPLLQTVGHGEYVMIHDEYRHFREREDRHDCYCTSNLAVRSFLKKWIREYIELFGDIRHFHLGGDEAYSFGTCPECAKHDKNRLYAEHIGALAEDLLAHGIRPGIWCDMILHYPESVEQISRQFVIWDWNYWDSFETPDKVLLWGKGHVSRAELPETTLRSIPEIVSADDKLVPFYPSDFLKHRGYDVILCSSSRSAGDSPFCPKFLIHAKNIVGAVKKSLKLDLLGTCVTSWAIRLNNYDVQEPLLALAPEAFADTNASCEEIIERICMKYFGDKNASKILESVSDFPRQYMQLTAIQWNNLKDSLQAPSGYIKNYLAKEDSENPMAKHNRAMMSLECMSNSADGLEKLRKLPPTRDTKIWQEAAELHYRFCKLFLLAFGEEPNLAAAIDDIRGLRMDTERLLLRFQTVASASKNTALIFDPLQEYFR